MRNDFTYPKLAVRAVICRNGLLLVTVKRDPTGLGFVCPGGAQNHGETLSQAIRRECLEEIGCDVTVADVLFVREYLANNHKDFAAEGDLHLVEVFFECAVPDSYVAQSGFDTDDDQVDVQWIAVDDLENLPFYPVDLAKHLSTTTATTIYVGDIY
jgi:8-oxo-dGTP diphosphatase